MQLSPQYNFRTFPSSPREPLCPVSEISLIHPQPQATSDILSVSTDLSFQDIACNLSCLFLRLIHISIYQYFFPFCLFLKVCIEFIGMTLVNKFIQVSGVQFYNTSSVYCIVYSPPQVKSSIIIYPSLPSSTSPSSPFPYGSHCTVVCVYGVF